MPQRAMFATANVVNRWERVESSLEPERASARLPQTLLRHAPSNLPSCPRCGRRTEPREASTDEEPECLCSNFLPLRRLENGLGTKTLGHKKPHVRNILLARG